MPMTVPMMAANHSRRGAKSSACAGGRDSMIGTFRFSRNDCEYMAITIPLVVATYFNESTSTSRAFLSSSSKSATRGGGEVGGRPIRTPSEAEASSGFINCGTEVASFRVVDCFLDLRVIGTQPVEECSYHLHRQCDRIRGTTFLAI